MNDPTAKETRQVRFEGRVQGVFFRKTTESFSKSFPVAGYVRNLDDGSVELVVRGAAEAIDRFLEKIVAHYRSNISRWESVRVASAEPFDRFEIR